ncbi:SDR family NAD(P)-dependent oxidoreductase [Thiomicrorhabdus sp. 6S3-12]|uniref:SDR family NAD(P)-dependent oxidoreductase n=1 Tax=Thiomicrorhabdus sp. 6S3-12 TaxID=2819681 RepID=UPI001AADF071|nr:SDR family NAD(P)-dependent oxidoreductase [Thiomicrorhabdus sp. 6S3-12]MBO1925114.1 SDR family NAD(P)-dependent oxidoreductase [Thiomicrorhabdus sp. 6S3-12]
MKTHLITGAANGLGRELSRQLIAQGDSVILLDKDMKPLVQLYDELEEIAPQKAFLYPIDLLGANIDHYKEFGDILTKEFGELDSVFLNAAILPAFTPIEHFDYTQWYEVLHTNLNAHFHIIQQTLPLLLKSDGNLIAVSDSAVHETPAFYGAYGVAKCGLEQLMHSVAAENSASGMHCFIAELGAFATESRGRLFPGENPTQITSAESMVQALLSQMQVHTLLPGKATLINL